MSKIVLWASSIQRQADFYGDLFDLPRTQYQSEFAEITAGANSVLLHLLPVQLRSESFAQREDQPIKPIFTLEDIEGAIARIAKHDVSIGAQSKYGEFIYQDLVDLEGNVIQLQQAIRQ